MPKKTLAVAAPKSRTVPPQVKAPKETVDEQVGRLAKKWSESELQLLEKKYPKAVHAVRLTQLQERHMDPDQFAVRMAKLRQPPAPKETVAL
jgi:hypothetical protein